MSLLSPAYSLLTLLASPIALAFIAKSKRGRQRLTERLGHWDLTASNVLWFHGASVGEIQGLIPVIKEFKQKFPDKKVLLTATSATGLERGQEFVDYLKLLPLDNRLWIRRAIKNLSVSCFICAETEIWPELLGELKQKGVPVFFINARISSYSFKYYKFFSGFMSKILASATGIFSATEESRQRLIALGVPEELVTNLGNSKYDGRPAVSSEEEACKLRKKFFDSEGPVLTLGSLRPGEEEFWFPEIAELLNNQINIRIVIAPRHAEKYEFFAQELEKYGIDFVRWSKRRLDHEPPLSAKIILLDTFGDLESVYSFTDLAFIGGTLADWGGHNPLEAGQYKCAIAIGPFHSNVIDIVHSLKKKEAVRILKDRQTINDLLQEFLTEPQALKTSGQEAFLVWQQNSGASLRIVKAVTERLSFS